MKFNLAKTLAFICLAALVVSCKAQKYGDMGFSTLSKPYQTELNPFANFKVSVEEYSTVFRATIEPHQLQTYHIDLQPIRLSGVNWIVRFKKNYNYFNVSLLPSFVGTGVELVEVEASIKVFQKNDVKEDSLVKVLSKRTIKWTQSVVDELTIKNFIDLDSFHEDYVRDDKATFEIEINTIPVYQQDISPKSGLDIMKKKLLVKIEDIKDMGSANQNISAVADIRGVKWAVTATKKNGFLGVYLAVAENNLGKWTYDIDATFKLLTFNSSVEPIQDIFSHKYYVGSASQGFDEFISWTDLIAPLNQYVVNNTATLLVDVNVGEPQKIFTF